MGSPTTTLVVQIPAPLYDRLKQRVEQEIEESLHALPPEEAAVLAFLQQRLAREEREARVAG